MQQNDIGKRIRQLAAIIAVSSLPALASAQGTPPAGTPGAQPGAAATGTTGSTAAPAGSTATTGALPTPAAGYGDSNATAVSPPMGTNNANGVTTESGGEVDDGGSGNAGWFGLLGLIGLVGLWRGRKTNTTTTREPSTRV